MSQRFGMLLVLSVPLVAILGPLAFSAHGPSQLALRVSLAALASLVAGVSYFGGRLAITRLQGLAERHAAAIRRL
jgi:hypothetical protein